MSIHDSLRKTSMRYRGLTASLTFIVGRRLREPYPLKMSVIPKFWYKIDFVGAQNLLQEKTGVPTFSPHNAGVGRRNSSEKAGKMSRSIFIITLFETFLR